MHFVKLNPAVATYITARLRNTGGKYMYSSFVPSLVYSVTGSGLQDLKQYKTKVQKGNEQAQVLLASSVKYTEVQVGCSPCMKKKGIDPAKYVQYQTLTFVETDESGNILESELI